MRYVTQGNGSGPALPLADALEKHNERNPARRSLPQLRRGGPDLTNSKCSYWHFRFDADTSMKMEALTTFMKDQPEVKKVYLINQNYSHGHQVSKYAKECSSASARRADRRRRLRRWPRCATSRPTSPRSSSRAPTP
jgi:branched-chain amino acid transport system substrate-binding protein